jgi:riboflavin synthase
MFTGIITGVGRIAAVHDLGSSLHHGKRLTHRGARRLPRRRGPGRQHRAQRRLHDRHHADPEQHQFTIDISAESLDKTAGLARPGPSTWKKPCAPTTGWAGTSCPAMWTASAGHPLCQVGESWELRCAGPRRWRKLPGLQGLDHRQRRQPHRQPGPGQAARLRSQHQPDSPHGREHRAGRAARPAHQVNLEIDLIARYVERMLGAERPQPAKETA